MMISLQNYIIEQLDTENIKWKVDVWMKNHPEEVAAFNKVIQPWVTTRQLADADVEEFMNSIPDIRGFISFMTDEISDTGIHDADFETIKNIVKQF